MIEPRTLPLHEMPIHVCLIYAVWILGMMCGSRSEPRTDHPGQAAYWDMSEDERIEEWLGYE